MTPIAKRIEMAQKLLSRPHRSAMRPRAAHHAPCPDRKTQGEPGGQPHSRGENLLPHHRREGKRRNERDPGEKRQAEAAPAGARIRNCGDQKR